jgi:hypothetical protein
MKIKNIYKKYLFLGVFGLVFAANAKSKDSCVLPDSVKGVKITPSSLMQVAPRIPVGLKGQLNNWFAMQGTKELLDHLVQFSDVHMWEQDRDANNALLAQAGYENLSPNGYSAHIPGVDYIFKIAGQKDRLISMLATKGIVLDAAQQQDDALLHVYVSQFIPFVLPTYQTASRMAYYLLLKERAREKGYKHVRIPESYLVNVPGKPQTVEDADVMFIQKTVPGSQMLVHNPERADALSKKAIKELVDAVISVGLWNVQKNILVSDKDDVYLICNVDLVGLRQPKNSSAKDFFHKSKERFDENVYVGLVGLLDLFKDDAEKASYIQKRIKKDKRLEDSAYYDRLMELVKNK